MPADPRPARLLLLAPLVLAALASAALLVLPTYQEVSASAAGEAGAEVARSLTLFQAEGWTVLPLLAAPVLLAALPLLAGPHRRRLALAVAAVPLVAGCLLAAASIGLFYLPSAIAAAVAAFALSGRRPRPARP